MNTDERFKTASASMEWREGPPVVRVERSASPLTPDLPTPDPVPFAAPASKPVAAPVPTLGGSATGNPRNKCALQPGHSLMDWIRLGNSGTDLSGTGGRIRSVTPATLAQHCTADDAWLAIRGNVYNITRYLPYHPGGEEELMRGAGIDATKLFDEVHPWVNYQSILAKCLVGPLQREQLSTDEFSKLMFGGTQSKSAERLQEPSKAQEIMRKSMENLANCINPVKKKIGSKTNQSDSSANQKSVSDTNLNVNSIKKDPNRTSPSKIMQCFINSRDLPVSITHSRANSLDKSKSESDNSVSGPSVVLPRLPRFDWIQKSNQFSLIFYTKTLCNPRVTVKYDGTNNCNKLEVALMYDSFVNCFNFELESAIKWPGSVRVNLETGKVEIHLVKVVASIWSSYGLLSKTSVKKCVVSDPEKVELQVINNAEVSHNSRLISLRFCGSEMFTVPVGYHIRVYTDVNGSSCVRPYTPLWEGSGGEVRVLVKQYPGGAVSPWLAGRATNDLVFVSRPTGDFQLTKLQSVTRLWLLAAGTGITPMLAPMHYLLGRRLPKCTLVSLLFFNRTEEDILLRGELEEWSKKDERFHFTNVLSEPHDAWDGLSGRINKDLLTSHISSMNSSASDYDTSADSYFCVCGPSPFTQAAYMLLNECGYEDQFIHLFTG